MFLPTGTSTSENQDRPVFRQGSGNLPRNGSYLVAVKDYLHGAGEFIRFFELSMAVKVILHGHEHVPNAGKIPGPLPENPPILVLGCGSSVGKNTLYVQEAVQRGL